MILIEVFVPRPPHRLQELSSFTIVTGGFDIFIFDLNADPQWIWWKAHLGTLGLGQNMEVHWLFSFHPLSCFVKCNSTNPSTLGGPRSPKMKIHAIPYCDSRKKVDPEMPFLVSISGDWA